MTRCGALGALVLAAALAACATSGSPFGRVEPFHLTRMAGEGDAPRRASTRLVIDGLEADAAGRADGALELFERALQIDPTNGWAYLAIARFRTWGPQPREALHALDQAEARLGLEGLVTPGVEVHLRGLRGAALQAVGRADQGTPLLHEAREGDPDAWSDGYLDAGELL